MPTNKREIVKIINTEGYQWIRKGEEYTVKGRTANGVLIKVFGTEFHVLNEDITYVES